MGINRLNLLKSTPLANILYDIDLVLMDIGARGGLDEDFLPAAWAFTAIGFEPGPNALDSLNRKEQTHWKRVVIAPVAIGARNGVSKLFVPADCVGASLLPHNPEMVELFGYEQLHKSVKELNVDTLRLDDAAAKYHIGQVDCLKIDVEGAEMDIFLGATSTLAGCSAIKVEASFLMQRCNQPLIWEVMAFLHEKGFWLVDMIDLRKWRRRPVPAHPYVVDYVMPYSKGIVAQCDLVFLRDFRKIDNEEQAFRLSIMSAILGFFDYAVTVLRHFPEVSNNIKSRYGIDIEESYATISAKTGQHECRGALCDALRNIVLLLRACLGMLPYNKKVKPY